MKTTFVFLLAMLACCSLRAEEDINPFAPPETVVDEPPKANIDPFVPAQGVDKLGELEDLHRMVDKVVKPGGGGGPDYITIGAIGGSYNKSLDRVSILFRVGLKQYSDAIGHPDKNRGVALISGRPEAPDLYTWLRPFNVTKVNAEFIVTGSRKQLESMCLAFMPVEGRQRYLYSLRVAAQNMKDAQQGGGGNAPEPPSHPSTAPTKARATP